MVILRQEPLLIYMRSKAKFVLCWAILSHNELDGPMLALFEDSMAKRPIIEKLPLAAMSSSIRFGTTSQSYLDATLDQGQFLKDPRLDKSLLIALLAVSGRHQIGGGSIGKKGGSRTGPIWLCSSSLQHFYEFIKALSQSLLSFGSNAPEQSQLQCPDALHNYKPWPFVPTNEWEQFWDCPCPFVAPISETIKSKAESRYRPSSQSDIGTLRAFNEAMEASSTLTDTASRRRHPFSLFLGQQEAVDEPIPVLIRHEELPEMPFIAQKPAAGTGRHASVVLVEKAEMARLFGKDSLKQQQQNAAVQMANEVTVIQLLDEAIEQGGQEGKKQLRGRFVDAEVQTEQTMAKDGFWPRKGTEEVAKDEQKLVNEEKHRTSTENGAKEGRSEDCGPCASMDFNGEEEEDSVVPQAKMEVLNVDTTNFYRLDLTEQGGAMQKRATTAEEESATQF